MKLSRAFAIVLVMHVVAVGGIFAFNAIKTRQLSESRSDAVALQTETAAHSAAAPVASGTPQAPAIPASRRHIVKAGDTPYRLSQVYGVKLEDLLAVNFMKENSRIVVGQELKIPDGPAGAAAPPAPEPAVVREQPVRVANAPVRTATPAPTPAPVDADVKDLLGVTEAPKPPQKAPGKNTLPQSSGKTYTVVKGDNPYSIAKKLGVEQSELLRLNNIDDPKKLQIGQQLNVPAKTN